MCDAASHEGLLERVNRMHESQFGADKLIKTAGFALGFAASLLDLDHRYGPSDTVTKGLRQLAAKFADVRYALRFHGGYSGLLIELENMKNLTFLGGWKDPKIKYLLMGQSLTLMQYYICENLAWLGWTAPEWIGERFIRRTLGTTADRLSQWSCWGWGLMCALDMWSTRLKFRELNGIEAVVRKWKATQPSEVRNTVAPFVYCATVGCMNWVPLLICVCPFWFCDSS
eukprot:m.234292 g.234292  ORF g.234292 m.234292 type:complete len:228 (+) comp19315_c0_seq5:276-959(+)